MLETQLKGVLEGVLETQIKGVLEGMSETQSKGVLEGVSETQIKGELEGVLGTQIKVICELCAVNDYCFDDDRIDGQDDLMTSPHGSSVASKCTCAPGYYNNEDDTTTRTT